jgi:hypothetical protein
VRRSDEAFNAGKEIEAMKRLTLHRIASSLHRFCCPALPKGNVQEKAICVFYKYFTLSYYIVDLKV